MLLFKLFRSAEEDFGNYSCVASNLMGTSRYGTDALDDGEVTFKYFYALFYRCFMELNGRPFNLSFYPSTDQMHSPHYYQVHSSIILSILLSSLVFSQCRKIGAFSLSEYCENLR